MSYKISNMKPEDAMKEARILYEQGYRGVSRAYGGVSRVDITDKEMVEMFIKNNFGNSTSGVPACDIESQRDQYRRVYSKDKKDVDLLVYRYLGDIVAYEE